jgi:hypothetical protein
MKLSTTRKSLIYFFVISRGAFESFVTFGIKIDETLELLNKKH